MVELDPAAEAYDRVAPIYDQLNAVNNYELWLGRVLLPELEIHGLPVGAALDIGCGTGRAFEPLLARGWEVSGCDLSDGMLEQAKRKFGDRVAVFQADARSLGKIPAPGSAGFQLILLLNDVINYLTGDGDLNRVFAAVERNLALDGLALFDANTLSLLRSLFAPNGAGKGSQEATEWRGLSDKIQPGGIFEARLSGPNIKAHVHRERHWNQAEIDQALSAAGLRRVALLGQREMEGEILLQGPPDEERDSKMIFIVERSGLCRESQSG
jgi:SAM-dependent methyltransferase